jgi:diguanylate cyclase (GGDEF)-like protein/PAS domain S-box-containing protein
VSERTTAPPPPPSDRSARPAVWLVVAPVALEIDVALRAQDESARVVRTDGVGPALAGLVRGRDWDGVVVAAADTGDGGDGAAVMVALRLGAVAAPVLVVLDVVDVAEANRWRALGATDVVARADVGELAARLRALQEPRPAPDRAPEPEDAHDGRRWIDALASFQVAVDRAEDLDAAWSAAASAVAATTRGAGFEVWRPANDGLHLVLAAAHGVADDARLRDDPTVVDLTPREGLVRHVYEHGRPAWVGDLRRGDTADADAEAGPGRRPRLLRAPAAAALGLRAVHAEPLRVGDAVAAVLVGWFDAPEDRARAGDRMAWWAGRIGAALTAWRAARAAEADRAHVRDALDEAPMGVAACDADGRLTLANQAMGRAGLNALVGDVRERWQAAWTLRATDGATEVAVGEDPLSRALRGEVLQAAAFVSHSAGGRPRRWRVDAAPLWAPSGALAGARATFAPVETAVDAERTATSDLVLRDFRLLLDRAAELAAAVGEARELGDVWPALDAFVRATTPATRWSVVRGTTVEHAASLGAPARASATDDDLPSDRRVAASLRVGERELGTLTLLAVEPGSFDERHATAATMAANLIAVAVDHADLVVQERRLRSEAEASATHFRSMFDATPLAVSLTSLDDATVLDVNPAFAALVGFAREELVGRRIGDFENWADPTVRAAIKARVEAGVGVANQEVVLLRKDGSRLRCLASAERTEHRGRPAMLLTVVDVTERLAQEERMRQLATFREKLMGFVEQTLEEGFEGASFFQRLVESAVAATPGAEAGSLLLRDDEGDTYRFVAAVGYDLERLAPATFDDVEIRASTEATHPVVVYVHPEAVQGDERARLLRAYGRVDEIRATLTVPIVLSGRRVAALCLDAFADRDAFGDDAYRLATAFGAQVAALVKRRALEQALERMAYHDHLTGLPNRILFRDRLVQAIAHARRNGRRGAALFIDLDNLKVTNDTLGHAVGDALLRSVALRLQRAVRDEDTVARIGGDEFTVVLPEVKDAPAAARVAEKLLEAFRTPFAVAGHEVHATASLGITLFPDDAIDADALIQHGDTAMYHAKNQGKDRYRFFTRDMNRALLERASLEAQLRKALDRDEFTLHFQPRVALLDGRVTSVEALARWRHPERGWIPPDAFIAVAEESGLIGPVGRRLLELACAQGRRWVDAGTPVVVAVNLSARQLQEREFVQQIEQVLAATGFDPAHLEVELTESAVMRNVEENVEKLGALRALGVQISIDDFGTAYSSLNYLKRLPATALKIDRSFVTDVGDPERAPHDVGIVRAIVALARTLELTAIAEGIETPAQLAFLRQVGCDQGQGYLLGRPVPAPELDATLAAGLVPLPTPGTPGEPSG